MNDLAVELYGLCYMFADDLKTSCNFSENQIQDELNRSHQWTLDWGYPLDVDKGY